MILISIMVYVALCLLAPVGMPDGNQGTILALLRSYKKNELIDYGVFYSAETILKGFRDMQWYVVLLPVITSLYPMCNIKEKFFSPVYYYQVSRAGRKNYVRKNLLEAVGYTAAVNNLSLVFFFVIICMRFPWIDIRDGVETIGGINIAPMAKICLTTTLEAILLLCISLIMMNIFADVFFAMTLPMLMCYMGYKVINLHLIYLRKQYGLDYPESSLRWEILNPSYLVNADNGFERAFGMNVGVLYSVFIIVILSMLYAIYRWMNRRVYG